MSATVDSRVVEMRFDNKQFESGVATTMNTLDKFQRSLKMEGATKGLEAVQTSANKIDFSNIENMATRAGFHIQDVWQKVATAFEQHIALKIVNACKSMANALAINPVTTGWQEYETQIGAVQTILANTESKGTNLDQVNGALDTLNTYADKTIYNFTEMTRNIGTFTAAGVDLDTSVNAIQGIANLAAVSGSTSQQASTAMYQLSQALASGTVKLMDWNSVVNAGMGGQVFQDALKETAKVHKVKIDEMIKKEGSFRETLKSGWLTSEILTETLSHFTMAAEEGSEQWEKYKKSLMDQGYSEKQATSILKLSNTATDAATKVKTATQLWDTLKETAQSGWTQTWEIILGDFEEAKELFSGMYETLSPILEATAKARNTLLEGALTSNWDKMVTKINEAGIETERFEEKLKSTAKAHGIDVDKLIEEHGSLEKAFRSGAISSDILKESVKSLEGKLVDLSGVTRKLKKGMKGDDVKKVQQALEKLGHSVGKAGIDGSFGKATRNAVKAFQKANGLKVTGIVDSKTLKALEEAGGKADGLSESVGSLIANIDKLGGRELLIESLKNVFDALMSIVKPIGKAFRDIFPATTAEQLYSIIESINKFTKKLILGEKASENLRRTFKGVFAILDIGKQLFAAIAKAISPLFGKISKASGGLLEFTGNIGDWLVRLSNTIRESDAFGRAMEKIKTFCINAAEKIGNALGKIKNFFQPVIDGVKNFSEEVGKNISATADNVKERLGPLTVLGNFIKGIFIGLGKVIKIIFPYVSAAAQGIGNVLRDLMNRISDSIQNADYDSFFDLTSGGIIATIGVFIAKFIKAGGDLLDNAGGFMENIKGIFSGLQDCIGAFTESIKADTLKKIAIAIGILAVSLLVLSLIPSEKLTSALFSITVLFGELTGAMKILGNMGNMKGIGKTAAAIVALSYAMLTLSIALKIMSTMSWEGMGIALISMTVGLGELVGAVWLLSKIPEKNLRKSTKAIKKLASSLLILSIALKIMSTMSWEGMGIALISMTVGLGALVAAIKLLPKDTALKTAGLVGMATAMVILAAALKIMATMSWDDVARSLVTLAGSLAILVGAMALMKKAIPGAIAMAIIAPALIVLAGALKIMATMSWEEIAKGLVTLGGSLLIIAGAMTLMKKAIPGAAALLIVAAALAILTPVLKTLGSMSLGEIGKSLLMMAGVFAVFGVAAIALKPAVPTMLKLAAAFLLLGVGCAAIGAGVLMVGLGITALAAALASGGTAIVVFVSSIISLIPFIIEQVGLGIIKLCEVIAGGASSICKAITVIIVSVVDALIVSVPKLVEGLLVLITELLDALEAHLPTIVAHLVTIIVGLLNLLAQHMPALMDGIFTFIVSIIDCLASNIIRIVEPILGLIGAIFSGIADALGPIIQNVIAPILTVLAELFVGLFEVIRPYIPEISTMITSVAQVVSDAIVKIVTVLAPFIPVIADAIVKIADVIVDAIVRITEALAPFIPDITRMITDITRIIVDSMVAITDIIVDSVVKITEAIAPFIPDITQMITEVTTVVTDAIVKITETLAPFLPELKDIIVAITDHLTTLVQEIAPITDSITELTKTLGDKIIGIMNEVKETLEVTGDIISSTLEGISGVFDSAFNGIATVLDSVGSSIKSVLDGIAGVIESIGQAALDAGTGFENLANGVKTITDLKLVDMVASLAAVAAGIGDIAVHANKIEKVGTGMSKLSTGATTAASGFKAISTSVASVIAKLSSVETSVQKVVTAFKNAAKNMLAAGAELIAKAIAGIDSKKRKFVETAKALIKQFIDTIDGQIDDVEKVCTTLASSCANAISKKADSFKTAGKDLGAGLVNGINAKQTAVYNAGYALGQKAVQGEKDGQKSKSPSKLTILAGKWLGEGLIIGMDKMGEKVYRTGYALGEGATKTISSAISRVADIVNSDIDSQPTIRPVIDLSDVRSGVSAISGMLNLDSQVGVRANLAAISSTMNHRGQNGLNEEVVSAINKLRKDIGNIRGGDTYQLNGLTYDDGSNVSNAIKEIARYMKIEGRV